MNKQMFGVYMATLLLSFVCLPASAAEPDWKIFDQSLPNIFLESILNIFLCHSELLETNTVLLLVAPKF